MVGRPLRTAPVRLRSDERGFALVELLVSLGMFTLVLGSILGMLDFGIKQAPKDQERAIALREAQAGLDRMTRELRQAYRVLDAQAKSIYVVVGRATPPDIHVRYDCDVPNPANSAFRECVRWAAPVGQELPVSSPGQVVISRAISDVAFTYSPGPLDPTFVKVHLEFPQTGERSGGYKSSFVLDDGFYLRNTDVLR